MYHMLSSSLVVYREKCQVWNDPLFDFCMDFCNRYIYQQRYRAYLGYITLEGKEVFRSFKKNSIDNLRSIMMSISDFEIYGEDSEQFWTVAINLYTVSPKYTTFQFGVDYRNCLQADIEYMKMSLVDLCLTMKAISGFIGIDCIIPGGMTEAEEDLDCANFKYLYDNLDKLVRGCFWGNFIEDGFVKKIGGQETARKMCPSYIISELDGGGLYIENKGPLGKPINQDELIKLFKPVLLNLD